MLGFLLGFGMVNLIFFALHVTNRGSFPRPLTAKEEQEAIEKMEQGDKEARERLIIHNLRLVAHIVKKYHNTDKDQEDLLSIGTIGLMKAIDSFKSGKNIKLATYASRCIENEILMSLRAGKKSANDVLINEPIDFDNEGNPLTLLDIIAEDSNLVEQIDLKIKGERLLHYVNTLLTPNERYIIFKRYGLDGKDEQTQLEISKELGISRSYVSRIEKKALQKMRDAYNQPKERK